MPAAPAVLSATATLVTNAPVATSTAATRVTTTTTLAATAVAAPASPSPKAAPTTSTAAPAPLLTAQYAAFERKVAQPGTTLLECVLPHTVQGKVENQHVLGWSPMMTDAIPRQEEEATLGSAQNWAIGVRKGRIEYINLVTGKSTRRAPKGLGPEQLEHAKKMKALLTSRMQSMFRFAWGSGAASTAIANAAAKAPRPSQWDGITETEFATASPHAVAEMARRLSDMKPRERMWSDDFAPVRCLYARAHVGVYVVKRRKRQPKKVPRSSSCTDLGSLSPRSNMRRVRSFRDVTEAELLTDEIQPSEISSLRELLRTAWAARTGRDPTPAEMTELVTRALEMKNKGRSSPDGKTTTRRRGSSSPRAKDRSEKEEEEELLVVKQLRVDMMGPMYRHMLVQEWRLMSCIRHPYIVTLKAIYEAQIPCASTLPKPGAMTFPGEQQTDAEEKSRGGHIVAMVMPMFAGGTLLDAMRKKQATGAWTSEKEMKVVLKKLLLAVSHMHELGILHTDIKPENICCRRSNDITSVVLIDLGAAIVMKQRTRLMRSRADIHNGDKFFARTEGFEPPIGFTDCSYFSTKGDMFALGVVAFNLVAHLMLPDLAKYEGRIFDGVDKRRMSSLSDRCINIVKTLLHKDHAKRPSAAELLRDPWFASVGGL